MILLRPDYLLFMMIPAIVLFFFIITNRTATVSIFDKKILEKLTFDSGGLGRMGRNIMLFGALFMMIIALSRPAIEKGDVKTTSKSIDMLVALDISKSMLASDIYPNRLEFAKLRLYEFIDAFPEANIGVIAFSEQGFLVSPMTQDNGTLKYLIKNLSLESLSTQGTNLMVPIEKAKSFLKDVPQRVVVIFTDGGDDNAFEETIKAANEANEHIYLYATATNQGAPIQENGASIKDSEGNIVITKLNSKIKTLALETGGAYIVGGLGDDSVNIFVDDIKKKFEMSEKESKTVKEYKELFYYPLAMALLFLLFAFSSFPKRHLATLFIAGLVSLPNCTLEASILDFHTIDKAEEAYKSENYKEAVDAYEQVAVSKKSPQSFYDLGNALYKSGQYKEALKAYDTMVPKEKELAYKKAFNQGNSHFQLKAYDKALEVYESAQKIKTEPDLEYNIELTKKMLKQQEQNQDQQNNDEDKKQNQDQQQNDQKKNQDQKQKEQNQEKKDQEQNQDQKNQQGDQQDEKQSSDKKQDEHKEEKISEKEAKKWEERLEQMKPKTKPLPLTPTEASRSQHEKPW